MSNKSHIRNILLQANISCSNSLIKNTQSGKFCELYFDGYMCWQPTPAGVVANQSCSNEYIESDNEGFGTRECGTDGKWFTLANYTECGKLYVMAVSNETSIDYTLHEKWLPIIKNVRQSGYVLSTISLIIALFVFIYIKRLHCARNKLHINFFASFVMRALMALLKDSLFVKGTILPHEATYVDGEPVFNETMNYSWTCKAIISLWNYFITSSYMFLLMEGLYLHNLLFLKLFSEDGVSIYCYMGWGVPIFFIIPWIIFRAKYENLYCWTTKSNRYIAMLIEIPIGFSVIINFILFTMIVRILFVKLTSMYMQQRWTRYQKLIRAILILVPLFGVPYTISFILSYYVKQNQTLEILWLFFDQTFTAFQGLFASVVYCFMNNEVQIEIVRKYHFFKERKREFKRRSRTISHTTQIALAEELAELPQNNGTREELFFNKTSDYF